MPPTTTAISVATAAVVSEFATACRGETNSVLPRRLEPSERQ